MYDEMTSGPGRSVAKVGHRSVDAALLRARCVAPLQTQRARNELALTLEAVCGSQIGDLAWSSSCLTPSRFPVEFAVTSATDELRTVVDVLAPETDRRQAYPRAQDLAVQMGSRPAPAQLVDLLTRHQRTFVPRFGAWLGSRHDEGSSRHKTYIEVSPDPEAVWAMLDELSPAIRGAAGGLGRVRFVGIHLDDNPVIEVYVRCDAFGADKLAACISRAGIGCQGAASLQDAMCVGTGRGPTGPNHGFSIAIHEDRVVALATFGFARLRHGRDRCTRKTVLDQAQRENWPSARLYDRLTGPLAAETPMVRPIHSAIAHIATPGTDHLEQHITFAPPPQDHIIESLTGESEKEGEGQ